MYALKRGHRTPASISDAHKVHVNEGVGIPTRGLEPLPYDFTQAVRSLLASNSFPPRIGTNSLPRGKTRPHPGSERVRFLLDAAFTQIVRNLLAGDTQMSFRSGFRNDDEYIKWIEATNLSRGKQIEQLEIKLKTAEKVVDELGGADESIWERARANVLFPIECPGGSKSAAVPEGCSACGEDAGVSCNACGA